jgi:hypothetical protein
MTPSVKFKSKIFLTTPRYAAQRGVDYTQLRIAESHKISWDCLFKITLLKKNSDTKYPKILWIFIFDLYENLEENLEPLCTLYSFNPEVY